MKIQFRPSSPDVTVKVGKRCDVCILGEVDGVVELCTMLANPNSKGVRMGGQYGEYLIHALGPLSAKVAIETYERCRERQYPNHMDRYF